MAQNLLAHLISGLSKPFCKEQRPKIHPTQSKSVNTLPTCQKGVSADKSDMNSDVPDSHPINLGCPYWSNRKRNISEHSDDICFLDDDECNNANSNFCSYDDEEDDDTEDDDSSIFDTDVEELKKKLEYSECETLESDIAKDFKGNCNNKKVRFNLTPEIHTMYAWSYAYRSARKGNWESLARDRDRFRKRIENASKHLNPILTPEHRSFIYSTRFSIEM